MNIFEGARRIAKLIAALIVLGFSIAIILDRPLPVTVSYLIAAATMPPVRVDQCDLIDVIQTKEITTKSGVEVNVNLCFRSPKSVNQKLIKIEDAKKLGYSDAEIAEYFLSKTELDPLSPEAWLAANEPDSYSALKSLVPPYKLDTYIAAFQIPKTDETYISRLDWLQRAKNAGITLLRMFASLAGFWILVWTVGWIVRGFKGIPQGKDSRE